MQKYEKVLKSINRYVKCENTFNNMKSIKHEKVLKNIKNSKNNRK